MRIFIVDDENILSQSIKKSLSAIGYNVSIFASLEDLSRLAGNALCDLYIIDIGLPDEDGYHVIDYIRRDLKQTTPIIMLSGFQTIEHKVKALDLGADDYMTKPFSLEELIARIRSNMRRRGELLGSPILEYKKFSFHQKTRIAHFSDTEIDLNKKEKQLIEYFFQNTQKIVSKKVLLDEIWGIKHASDDEENTLSVTICNLRKKNVISVGPPNKNRRMIYSPKLKIFNTNKYFYLIHSTTFSTNCSIL